MTRPAVFWSPTDEAEVEKWLADGDLTDEDVRELEWRAETGSVDPQGPSPNWRPRQRRREP